MKPSLIIFIHQNSFYFGLRLYYLVLLFIVYSLFCSCKLIMTLFLFFCIYTPKQPSQLHSPVARLMFERSTKVTAQNFVEINRLVWTMINQNTLIDLTRMVCVATALLIDKSWSSVWYLLPRGTGQVSMAQFGVGKPWSVVFLLCCVQESGICFSNCDVIYWSLWV